MKPYDIKERSYQYAKEMIFFVSGTKFDRIYYSLFDQVLRSGTSIGANIEEGKAGSSKRDFKKFYIIALKSANETKYWLRLIKETGILKECEKNIDELITEAEELAKIIASIIINLKE